MPAPASLTLLQWPFRLFGVEEEAWETLVDPQALGARAMCSDMCNVHGPSPATACELLPDTADFLSV